MVDWSVFDKSSDDSVLAPAGELEEATSSESFVTEEEEEDGDSSSLEERGWGEAGGGGTGREQSDSNHEDSEQGTPLTKQKKQAKVISPLEAYISPTVTSSDLLDSIMDRESL